MATQPSKYAANQFEIATRRRFPRMSEVLREAAIRRPAPANGEPYLVLARDAVAAVNAN